MQGQQNGFMKYLMLPKEKTNAELKHVKEMNRIALFVCLAHIPLFVLVAWLCDTGVLQALGFGVFLVAGPLLAYRTIENPRMLSMIFGFTAMSLGALLVHLGQGLFRSKCTFTFLHH